jgi:hypothetical protein
MWGIPLDPKPEEDEEDDDGAELEAGADDQSTKTGKRMFEKMEDVELVLRFFAYRQIESFKAGLNKISEFLDRFLIEGNRFPDEILGTYRSMFEATLQFLLDSLGTDAFCAIGISHRPTKIVYDPIMFVANSNVVVKHRQQLVSHNEVLRNELTSMYRKNQALFSGRRTNFADTQARNACVSKSFADAIAKIQHDDVHGD